MWKCSALSFFPPATNRQRVKHISLRTLSVKRRWPRCVNESMFEKQKMTQKVSLIRYQQLTWNTVRGLVMHSKLIVLSHRTSFSVINLSLRIQDLTFSITPWYLSVPEGLTSTWWGCYGLCFWHKPTELAHSFFYSVLVSVSVFMALPTAFHSINSPLSHSVLPVVFLTH